MEPVTALVHRFVMHGFGRSLHASHHRNHRLPDRSSSWEANDLYPAMFAALVMFAMAIGFNVNGWQALVPLGIGITAYGAAYALVHDVYTHRRLTWFGTRTVASLDRLAAAHRVHHEASGAPYGMLVPVLRASRPARGSRPSQEPLEA